MDDDGTPGRRSKVARLIDEYALDPIGEELEERWTADGDDRTSLRGLADYFNRRLLAAKLADAEVQPISASVDAIYRRLTDDDVGDADRTRTRRRLEREGLDVDSVERDFVTYQAVRTYLTEYRGAKYRTDDRSRPAAAAETIRRLRGRLGTVTDEKLDRLASGDHLRIGEFRTFTEVTVLCEDCGSQYGVGELLDRGACDCPARSE
jgi:hypothetical protein